MAVLECAAWDPWGQNCAMWRVCGPECCIASPDPAAVPSGTAPFLGYGCVPPGLSMAERVHQKRANADPTRLEGDVAVPIRAYNRAPLQARGCDADACERCDGDCQLVYDEHLRKMVMRCMDFHSGQDLSACHDRVAPAPTPTPGTPSGFGFAAMPAVPRPAGVARPRMAHRRWALAVR